MKFAVVIGTRPELIKMAPVMRELARRKIDFVFIHSDQHYSKFLDEDIIANLNLPPVDYHLNVGSGTHAAQTGKIMMGVEEVFSKIKPDFVLVHGDTNTTLAAALGAVKMHIKVAHIEAGLRSFDYSMPEEINRMLADRISDLCFATSQTSKENLLSEGIQKERIVVSGNTVVDALNQHLEIADTKSSVLEKININPGEYVFATAHRPENVDTQSQLEAVIELLNQLSSHIGVPVVFPVHPRTKSNLEKFGIKVDKKQIVLMPPVDYLDTLKLIKESKLVVTDSGGIQEEAFCLKKPLITIRTSTERPETLTANFIVGLDAKLAIQSWDKFASGYGEWTQALGDGHAAERIVDSLLKAKG